MVNIKDPLSKFKLHKFGILETPNYIVHVGTVPGDKVPQYLIFHKEYGVLEFAHNMIYFVNQALEEMEEKLDQQTQEAKMEELPPVEAIEPKKTKNRKLN